MSKKLPYVQYCICGLHPLCQYEKQLKPLDILTIVPIVHLQVSQAGSITLSPCTLHLPLTPRLMRPMRPLQAAQAQGKATVEDFKRRPVLS